VIDVDQPDTWPPAVLLWASRYAEALRDSTVITQDLGVPIEREDELRAMFGGNHVLAFHSTRLLDHEMLAVREQGLRVLSLQLVEERAEEAYRRGFLTDAERDRFFARNVFALGEPDGREQRVCMTVGRSVYDNPHSGCQPLLSFWGGEGMNGGPLGEPEHLTVGRPSIVVARIDLSVSQQVAWTFPSLGMLFVGTLLGTEKRWADVPLPAAVPARDILDIWQPGRPEYDRHGGVPS
jgi:hypothetical protein